MRAVHRRGLTMIDSVVVVILLLVFFALTFPAMYSSQEAARRSDCKNKLKTLGLGLSNYEEIYGSFPPGWVAVRSSFSSEQEESAYGWVTFLLPYLDHKPLYQKIDFSHTGNPSFQYQAQRSGFAFAAEQLPALRCPSDAGDGIDYSSSVSAMGLSSYVGNFGVGIPPLDHDRQPYVVQGVFGCDAGIRIRDIRDGLSNTAFAGERMTPRVGGFWPPHEVDGRFNSYWAGIPAGTNPLAIVATSSEGDVYSHLLDDPLCLSGNLRGFNEQPPRIRVILPNKTIRGNPLTERETQGKLTSAGFSSYHPGGVQILLGDMSSRFVRNSVNPNTWLNLMRRLDGETLGEF